MEQNFKTETGRAEEAVKRLAKRQAEKQELIELHIERLIFAGLQKGLIGDDDINIVRNSLLRLFGIDKPYAGRVNKSDQYDLSDTLRTLTALSAKRGICRDTESAREDFASKIMGFMTPRGSEVTKKFQTLYKRSPQAATEWFFGFSQDVDYIKTAKKNIKWLTETKYGWLDITINVSKPEKDPKEIEAAKNAPQRSYPKCLLCPQCAGYGGNEYGFPARDNHRIIPLKLNDKKWFLQYSPYQYYNEHCIALYENHVPMKISEKTFEALFDFIEQFPHYFIGSNADLPIVGGSILVHEHYQGGRYNFAIESAKTLREFENDSFQRVSAEVLYWPLSTIRLKCESRSELMSAAVHLMNEWRGYSDDIIVASTFDNEQSIEIQHNTITPILRKKHGVFELDIVLRNNLTSDARPLGIYHPASDRWHIKKENIGLIEVMGLAVLPARLIGECVKIRAVLTGGETSHSKWDGDGREWRDDYETRTPAELMADGTYIEQNPELEKHEEWIKKLIQKYGCDNDDRTARSIIEREVGLVFAGCLADCGVFPVEGDLSRFEAFMEKAGFVGKE